MTSIPILRAGGTLEKEYDEHSGDLGFRGGHIAQMLRRARCSAVEVLPRLVFLKDSLDMTDEDREAIRDACVRSPHDRIVITYGTDTMVETARHLAARIDGKTIVLVGAMVPYPFGGSDALFSLGFALAAVQLLPPGVYVAMNRRAFTWDNVRKDKTLGRFVALRDDCPASGWGEGALSEWATSQVSSDS